MPTATTTPANPPQHDGVTDFPVDAAVVGAGPAGLMAAEQLAAAGWRVHVYDAMPSAGRKFLLAGKGGLNLTHSEPAAAFLGRYGERAPWVGPWLEAFGAPQVRAWAHGLGVDTFVGSSGRVFPQEMKAAPLLRAWLSRLRAAGVQLHMRERWHGWADGGFESPMIWVCHRRFLNQVCRRWRQLRRLDRDEAMRENHPRDNESHGGL